MKLELRKIAHYPRASEETIAFDADLYVDDVKVGTVSNSGRGGANVPRVQDAAMLERIDAHCKSLPPYQSTSAMDLPMDLDLQISMLVSEFVCRKKVQRWMKDRILLTDGKRLLQTPRLASDERARLLANPGSLCDGGKRIVNEAEAVRLMADQP